MYLQDESFDNLRRRGRWARMATLEIYVQEVGPFEFLADLAPPVMEGLLAASASFENVVARALRLLGDGVPLASWPRHFGARAG